MSEGHQLRQSINHLQTVEILSASDGRQRCKASGHERRLATHHTDNAQFCPECAHRIKHGRQYGGPTVIKEIKR